jgi:hypothetical protein
VDHRGGSDRRDGIGVGHGSRRDTAFLQPLQPGEQRRLPLCGSGKQGPGAHQLEQQPGRGRPAHLGQAGVEDLRRAGQLGRAHRGRLALKPFELVGGPVEQPARGRLRHVGQDHQVAEALQQVHREAAGVVASVDHPVHGVEHLRAVTAREGGDHVVEQVAVGVAQQRDRTRVGDARFVRPGEKLVEDRQRVTGRARARPDHQRQRGGLECDLLGGEDLLHEGAQRGGRDQPERVVVGPGLDRPDDLLGLRGREDELQVRRRLLDEFEQRVETLAGHHVRLVDDVDLEA